LQLRSPEAATDYLTPVVSYAALSALFTGSVRLERRGQNERTRLDSAIVAEQLLLLLLCS